MVVLSLLILQMLGPKLMKKKTKKKMRLAAGRQRFPGTAAKAVPLHRIQQT
jgi:hypothetical protein